jgi:hypothetical protein
LVKGFVSVHLVVTHRNKSERTLWNLSSIVGQDYDQLRVSYIDDASHAAHRSQVSDVLDALSPLCRHRIEPDFYRKRRGVIKNILTALEDTKNDEVVVLLDGDDAFSHPGAISRIAREYIDPDCWMTYGGFLAWPEYKTVYDGAYDPECIRQNLFRKWFWRCAPPRSFRMGLLRKIPPEYHLDQDGTHWELANDQGLLLPALELAGSHIRHIPDVLYLYDLWNWRTPTTEQSCALADAVDRIRARPALHPLTERPW